MDIVDRVREAVLRQQEESISNYFTRVADMRDFLVINMPGAGEELTVKMVCFAAERLTADNGTRVTLIDFLAHATFPGLFKDLSELNVINRKPVVIQITVWDAKKRVGSPKAVPMQSRQGAVYEFKQVHNVEFYAEVPKGSVQLEDGVTQRAAPILKRKGDREPSGRKGKARALVMQSAEEKNDDNVLEAVVTTAVSRTRGAAANRP